MLINSASIHYKRFVVYGRTVATSPGYLILPSTSNVNEGQTVTFTVDTVNVPVGSTLYWKLSGGNSADFDATSGTVTVNAQESVTFNVQVLNDATTEGTESFYATLHTDSIFGPTVATSNSITIGDTSLTQTYTIVPASLEINEGGIAFFEINTTNVPNGTVCNWIILNGNDPLYFSQTADFVSTSGNVTIADNYGTISVNIVADSLTEGIQKFYLSLKDSSNTNTLASSPLITINDTSTTPVPTYSISAPVASLNEGENTTFVVTTTNVANGTTLYWNVAGTVNASDVIASSGSVSINSSTGNINIIIISDSTTEGPESLYLTLHTGSTSGPIVATSNTITVNDTSTAAAPTYPINIQYLVVAGGGGGGAASRGYGGLRDYYGGGGGGGGYCNGVLPVDASGQFCVIIGAGGVAGQYFFTNSTTSFFAPVTYATNGNPSQLCNPSINVSTTGGGAGGTATMTLVTRTGSLAPAGIRTCANYVKVCHGCPGGSGGGASLDGQDIFPANQLGARGEGSPGIGYPGGCAVKTPSIGPASGGGGGAGGPGLTYCNINPQAQCGARGGPGKQWIDGNYYAGGGGGGTICGGGSEGGIGGGGPMSVTCYDKVLNGPYPGQTNTGGGGGGRLAKYACGCVASGQPPQQLTCTMAEWACCPAGAGGSGVVKILYEGPQRATGGTVSCAGTCTIHTFASSGLICFCSNYI